MEEDVNLDRFKFRLEPQFNYAPKEDITIFELAQLIVILQHNDGFEIDELSEDLKRHFRQIDE